jgi:hypothetical protein
MNKFTEELGALNMTHRATTNAPTRSVAMIQTALIVMDGFKMNATGGNVGCTEEEFLANCKRAYWQAREIWQGITVGALKAGSR